jgi:hypothetical protein
MRPKVTRLTQAELIEAEACFAMVKGIGHNLYAAEQSLMRNPPSARSEVTFEVGSRQFLEGAGMGTLFMRAPSCVDPAASCARAPSPALGGCIAV